MYFYINKDLTKDGSVVDDKDFILKQKGSYC